MKDDKVIKWYACKRDIIVTLLILIVYGIAAIEFKMLDLFYHKEWTYNLSMIWGMVFEWGLWLITLAIFIEAIFICLEHYFPIWVQVQFYVLHM